MTRCPQAKLLVQQSQYDESCSCSLQFACNQCIGGNGPRISG